MICLGFSLSGTVVLASLFLHEHGNEEKAISVADIFCKEALNLLRSLVMPEQVAAAIKIVLKSSQPNLVVKLDMQRIEAQGYEGINADSVQLSIINYPKLKLKSQV